MRKDSKGQITVALALLFLVLSTAILWLTDGMRLYFLKGLARDALEGAGEEVTANYDRSLYQRYRLFVLDPRENSYIESDGEDYIKKYLGDSSGKSISSGNLLITNKFSILDENGKYFMDQINQWMKYKKISDGKQALEKLAGHYEEVKENTKDITDQIESAEEKEMSYENEAEKDGQEGESEEKEDSRWKELKETLDDILHSGILHYAAGDREISSLEISVEKLEKAPSKNQGDYGEAVEVPAISFSGIKRLKNILKEIAGKGEEGEEKELSLGEEYLILDYVEDNFRKWTDESWDFSTALHYEMEYLIGGKNKDEENLKYVANKIFLIRFAVNYAYASQDAVLVSQAEAIGSVIGGTLGMPVLAEAVKVVLLSALSYGEALLDVHTLFAGKKVPLLKDASTFTLSFENAGRHLREKTIVKEGEVNIDYTDYLKMFLGIRMSKKSTFLRMADIMQNDIQLDEEGFLMKEALVFFQWETDFQCVNWFKFANVSETQIHIEGSAGY